MSNHYTFRLILIIVFSAQLIGCATAPLKGTDLKESLRAQAVKYWDMRMKDRYEEAYELEDREGLPPYPEYMNRAMMIKRINVTSHSIGEIRIEGNTGVVDVEFSFVMPPVTRPFKQVIKDEWVYKAGRWQHRFR